MCNVVIVGPLNLANDSSATQALAERIADDLKLGFVAYSTFADGDGHVSMIIRCKAIVEE